jgi:hypothetical protein
VTKTRLAQYAFLIGAASSLTANAETNYPGDDQSFKGDKLTFRTHAKGIKPTDAPQNSKVTLCLTPDTVVRVREETTDAITFRVIELPEAAKPPCLDKDQQHVATGIQYTISKADLNAYDYYRTGFSFGGLVVPFKVRLGDDKELVASPAIAPFVGYRTHWLQSFGVTFTPVVAAGLSLVPVPTADGKETETKSAYTMALGFRVTSSKNGSFSAGLLYGRDFLGKRVAASDPLLQKPWFSFYLGASI